jgi:hypothetical protein
MKFSRLFRPRHPLFRIMIAVNLLSLVLAKIAQSYPLNTLGSILVYGFALLNAIAGLVLAWRLASDDSGK